VEERLWRPVTEEPSHPLCVLHGRPLGDGRLLARLGPANRVGARYFQLLLQDAHGFLQRPPVVVGMHHQGPYPSFNWIEVMTTSCLAEHEPVLFTYLTEVIPPGGHLMVEYESAERRETERLLAQGVPPVLTPLGWLMFQAGCDAGFRDWYISEGGSEGPRKLQGFKCLDEAHRRQKCAELAQEVQAYLRSRPDAAEPVRQRAVQLLRQLSEGTH